MKGLLGIEDLTREEVQAILDRARGISRWVPGSASANSIC